jgi:hypothetical protein
MIGRDPDLQGGGRRQQRAWPFLLCVTPAPEHDRAIHVRGDNSGEQRHAQRVALWPEQRRARPAVGPGLREEEGARGGVATLTILYFGRGLIKTFLSEAFDPGERNNLFGPDHIVEYVQVWGGRHGGATPSFSGVRNSESLPFLLCRHQALGQGARGRHRRQREWTSALLRQHDRERRGRHGDKRDQCQVDGEAWGALVGADRAD